MYCSMGSLEKIVCSENSKEQGMRGHEWGKVAARSLHCIIHSLECRWCSKSWGENKKIQCQCILELRKVASLTCETS